jgi:hypothetical protein
MYAQPKAGEHWSPVVEPTSMQMSAVLVIDGEEIGAEAQQLEIGFFDQTGKCRAAKMAKKKTSGGVTRYKYSPVIYGDPTETETYTCRIWDHNTDSERTDLVYVPNTDDPLVWHQHGYVYGTSSEPYVISFVTDAGGFELPITGYGEGSGNWYLIASPVGQVSPDAVQGLVNEAGYDLFSFDQSQNGAEWQNHKGSDLMPGIGYLYANVNDTTLVFSGAGYTGSGEVTVAYDADANCTGFNLVGNPFGEEAYLSVPYYTMNGDETGGTEIMTESSSAAILPMRGVFVQATEAGTVTFSTEAPGDKNASLALNLSNGRSVVDRAIVRFDGGQQLNKFQLNPNSTKVYIPQDNEDYAVVRSEGMGEMPVSFKAEQNGTYSMSFRSENVRFGYLHLIDNMTGADVDLLANPSYSFDALTTDYASRFRLVFATIDGNGDSFAFYSNGSFVISNEGEATLQVVDVTGRILKSESISGCASVNIDAAPGVYMIRLVNNDNMKVQKVIVK